MIGYRIHPRYGIAVPAGWLGALPKTKERVINYMSRRFRFGMPKFQRGVLHPLGFWAEPAGAGGTLALTNLNDSDVSSSLAFATVAFKRDGNVAEGGVNQNPSTEWIDTVSATVGDDYECKVDQTSGFTFNYTGGQVWADNVYDTLDEQLSVSISHSGPANGIRSGTGTATVREIADTLNNVSAQVNLSAEYTGGGGIVIIP